MNISPKKMCYINVLSGDRTIKYLYDKGVKFFVFDNFKSLENFNNYVNLSECKILDSW